MAKRAFISTAVTLVLLGFAGAGYYRLTRGQSEAFCGFCHRVVHAQTQVIAEVDGRRRTVCCARCAITEGLQEKRPVRLVTVTDYVSGKSLKPEQAYFVEGSRKILCARDMAMLDETKHAFSQTFDRCSPGAYAFAHREDAAAFVRENGGEMLQLNEMMQGVAQ